MTRVLILVANDQLARNTTRMLLDRIDAALTRYSRRSARRKNPVPDRTTVVEGDVLDEVTLRGAMQGQDMVFANLAGDMAR